MFKKISACIIAIVFFVGVTPGFGKDVKEPTPNKKAYENASDNARFNRVENMKNKEMEQTARKAQKEAEKMKREAEKSAKKAEKEAEKAKREAERKAKRLAK